MHLSDHFSRVSRQLEVVRAIASYYPYTELKHTWSRGDDFIRFKISDYMADSPEDVLDSMAWYLVCRASRKECPGHRAERYLEYLRSSELWSRVKTTYISRQKGLVLDPRGDHRDISQVFDYVNSNYFGGRIRDPVLAWVRESPHKRLGYYFPPLKLLAVNKAFDTERVPRFALEFVVYHELLHHLDAIDAKPRRRVQHTRSFREQERLFSSYSDAERWLRRLAARGRSRRK